MTSQTQLTLWRFGSSTNWIVDPSGEPVCEYYGDKANGHLIRSAPELLRELMKLVSECELAAQKTGDTDATWLEAARTAILKAGPHRHSVHNTEEELSIMGTVAHRVYEAVVRAVKQGQLTEPFTKSEFKAACPGFGEGTYNAFLHKHAAGNPGGNSELFVCVSAGSSSASALLSTGCKQPDHHAVFIGGMEYGVFSHDEAQILEMRFNSKK